MIYIVSKFKNKESLKVKEEVKDDVIFFEEVGIFVVFLCLVFFWNLLLLCNFKYYILFWLYIFYILFLNNFLILK